MMDRSYKRIYLEMFLYIVVPILLINSYPIYQFLKYKTYYFYQNAFDEYSYLSFDFLKYSTQQFGRQLSKLVLVLQEIGLSGAFINLIFDWLSVAIMYSIIVLLIRKSNNASNVEKHFFVSFVVVFSPFLIGSSNPLVGKLNNFLLNNKTIVYFFTFPEGYFLPIQRTPEPQLSIIFALIFLLLLQRIPGKITYFLALTIIPLLYVYVSLPIFCGVAIYILQNFLFKRSPLWKRIVFSTLLVYLGISLVLNIYFNFFHKDKLLITNTHLPMLGMSLIWILLTLIVCKILFKNVKLSESENALIYTLLFTSILVLNTQIISGYITQPNNFEQYFSIYIPAIIFSIYYLKSDREHKTISAIITIAIYIAILFHLRIVINLNEPIVSRFHILYKNNAFSSSLNIPNLKITTGDYLLDSFITGFKNPKATLVLNYTNTYYGFFKKQYYCDYINFKRRFGNEKDTSISMSISVLDRAYKYLNNDHIFLHHYRRNLYEFTFDCDSNNSIDILLFRVAN